MNKFAKDSRTPCKYGENCYQKNPQHHKRFKHPPKTNEEELSDNQDEIFDSPPSKKLKTDDSNKLKPNKELLKKDDAKTDIADKDTSETNTEDKADEDASKTDSEDKVDEEDENILPSSPQSMSESIKQKFLVDMPRDFYDFWEFCKTLNKKHPEDALAEFGLKLVGAYDVVSGKLKEVKEKKLSAYLCHWRYYYDPPEFQTIIVGDKDEYHIGYFRDDPSEDPVFLASMSSKSNTIQTLKEDLFSSIHYYMKTICKVETSKRDAILKKIKSFATEKDYDLDSVSKRFKERKKKVVSKSFHGAGIVVPVNKDTDVGYREIPETDANLRRIMKKVAEAKSQEIKTKNFEDIQELMTNVQWATDEGDFGMGLELGIDLFMYGSKDFHSFILHLLIVAYDLLNRKAFSTIIRAHLKNRRKGSNLSSFKDDEKKP